MALAQSQPDQEVASIVEVVLLVVAGESQDGKLPFYHPGQFQWKEPTILRPGGEGRSAADAERAEDGDNNAGNHAHSC